MEEKELLQRLMILENSVRTLKRNLKADSLHVPFEKNMDEGLYLLVEIIENTNTREWFANYRKFHEDDISLSIKIMRNNNTDK